MNYKLWILFNVFVLIYVTESEEVDKCGRTFSRKLARSLPKPTEAPANVEGPRIGKIVGGKDARPGDMPSIVSIQQNYAHFCGGTILNHNWVLTAAHCFKDKGIPEKELQVKSGTYDIPQNTPGNYHSVIKYIIHEEFALTHYRNDVALLQITPPFNFFRGKKLGRQSVWPICMPKENAHYLGEATVAGWGLNSSNGDQAMARLQAADINIFDCTDDCLCKTAYSVFNSDLMVCAGMKEGAIDACQGDSGGPLMGMKQDADGEDIIVQIGVVSYGEGCAEAYKPGVYADLATLLPWVKQNIAPDTVFTPKY